ncbi:TetR/AcrR family transcriptional regulator [Streptomyces sp. WAC08241]|uniref:TetR/AcrR family transcriptional regulator n=1 Tax=Streptomyces sp. WAC08241 TaxID=2487421 RepID=UPI000F786D21|nr:TetR/AcrR family transcriptional regulator [Streptomyces sp. WAC08241]RSS47093.1 TetR/AcrR family transcriptional regulator [Streptomyces sp. WAC08241]
MRADARRNRDHLLTVARPAVVEHGIDVSMRDVARRAGVGLATLLRHFPTREALMEALLHESFEELTARAHDSAASRAPADALVTWVRECVAWTTEYRGVTVLMAAAIEDPDSALHTSCVALRAAGAGLLLRAQEAGAARDDLDGEDLFALIAMLAWTGDQPALASRADRLLHVVVRSLLTDRGALPGVGEPA